MCLCNLLAVLVNDLGGDAFHAEDLNLEALSARVRVLDVCKILLVDLVHMHGETCVMVSRQPQQAQALDEPQRVERLRILGKCVPPAVFNLLPQRSHLKCFAFW
jgi:hypothetical protein